MLCFFLLGFLPATVRAEAARPTYNLGEKPLSQALLDLSRQGGIVVVAPSDLVAGKLSRSLNGAYAPQDALSILLDGTGLFARQVSATSFVLMRLPQPTTSGPATGGPYRHDRGRPTEVIVTAARDLTFTRSPQDISGAMSGSTLSHERLSLAGSGDLSQILAYTIPAMAMQAFGRDAANNTPSVRLRDLSPNDTLVLVNGRRRHGTSSLSVIAGPFQGGASADFRLIPINLIDHIDVVTDGLGAGYGCDAMAGVVNIVLKTRQTGGSLTTATGGYFDGGGQTGDMAVNLGVVSSPTGFLQVGFQTKYHGYSQRGAIDPRVLAYPQLATTRDYPYLNKVFGDGTFRLNVFGFNGQSDLAEGWEAYGFGLVGLKTASSRENWRPPVRLAALYPQGFTPIEAVKEQDSDYTFGLRGPLAGWDVDVAFSHGSDHQNIGNYGGGNVSLFADTGETPTHFFIGEFLRDQSIFNLDARRDLHPDARHTLSLAFGVEARRETYAIGQGDAPSMYKEGAQGFPGFSAQDAGRYRQHDSAAYIDLTMNDAARLKLDAGVRLEHVEGFRFALIGRMSARWAIMPALALRMALSNGWRAPSLAESNYSATNVSPSAATLQLPPSAAAVTTLGLAPLVPETSRHLSVGLNLRPVGNLNISINGYQIDILNRIVGSGTLYGFGSPDGRNSIAVLDTIQARNVTLDPSVTKASLSVFTNGLDTRSRGVEVLMDTSWISAAYRIRLSLNGNVSLTRITHMRPTPTPLQPQDLFDPFTVSTLQDASPAYRWILDTQIAEDAWSLNLRATLNGHSATTLNSNSYTENGVNYPAEWIRSVIHPHIIFDAEIGYKLTTRLSLFVGADNIFNVYPERLDPSLLHSYAMSNSNLATYAYASWSPFGINGGYYFTRLKVDF